MASRLLLGLLFVVAPSCTKSAPGSPGDPGGSVDSGLSGDPVALHVRGQVVDFKTGQPMVPVVSLSTTDLSPAPTVTMTSPMFVLDNVTPHSVFYAVATAAGYRPTYSPAINVEAADVDGVVLPAAAEPYLQQLATAFGVTPSAANGLLLAQLVDSMGHGIPNIAASAIAPIAGARGPFFLDPALAAAVGATKTSSSGWVVYFDVAPGKTSVSGVTGGTYTLAMPTSPIAPATATIATVQVTNGAPVLPKNVSFVNDVVPIFQNRGCQSCHSGGGPGKDLANLTLNGGTNLIYKELMDPAVTSATLKRVDRAVPEKSLVLTMPSAETPPDGHPNVTFTGPSDIGYLKILVWIREGAKQN